MMMCVYVCGGVKLHSHLLPPLFTNAYPPIFLPAPHQPVEMSHQPPANRTEAQRSRIRITGVFMCSNREEKMKWRIVQEDSGVGLVAHNNMTNRLI